mmetsp:Transcript_31344/g.67648  ORF Transcript_31344/g.67648 Transcript_31344/m.67648 type:complete len:245 (+) Transcript_31344:1465-2199(+)
MRPTTCSTTGLSGTKGMYRQVGAGATPPCTFSCTPQSAPPRPPLRSNPLSLLHLHHDLGDGAQKVLHRREQAPPTELRGLAATVHGLDDLEEVHVHGAEGDVGLVDVDVVRRLRRLGVGVRDEELDVREDRFDQLELPEVRELLALLVDDGASSKLPTTVRGHQLVDQLPRCLRILRCTDGMQLSFQRVLIPLLVGVSFPLVPDGREGLLARGHVLHKDQAAAAAQASVRLEDLVLPRLEGAVA